MNKIVMGFCAFILCVNNVVAANTNQTFKEAVTFLKAGSADKAYDLLIKNHDTKSTNLQEYFLLGIAAKQTDKLADAGKHLEKLIALDPNASRAKLELADVAQRQGNSKKAKQLLLDVKASNPPAGVVATIDRLLASLEARGRQQKSWRIRTSLGWLHDSNANAGPTSNTVELYGVPFTLSTDAKETSDSASVLRLGFDHNKAISNSMSWQSNVSFSWTDYKTLNNLDSVSWSGSSGAAWRQNNTTIWSLPLLYNWVKIGHVSNFYYYSYGIAPQVRFISSPKLSYSIGTSITHKKYLSSNARNTTSYSLSPSFDYKINTRGTLRVGASVSEDDSGLQYYSNNSLGLNVSYFHNFSKHLIMTLSGGYAELGYKGKEAAYSKKREDTNTRLGFNLLYHLKSIGSELVFAVNYSDNDSNLGMYAHKRTQTSISIRKAF